MQRFKKMFRVRSCRFLKRRPVRVTNRKWLRLQTVILRKISTILSLLLPTGSRVGILSFQTSFFHNSLTKPIILFQVSETSFPLSIFLFRFQKFLRKDSVLLKGLWKKLRKNLKILSLILSKTLNIKEISRDLIFFMTHRQLFRLDEPNFEKILSFYGKFPF